VALIDNLAVYYSCDEASGNLIDAHSTIDLTDNNTVGAATGKVSGGRDFEVANTEYFSCADNATISMGDIDFTIAFWVQFESIGMRQMLVAKDQDTSREYRVTLRDGAAGDSLTFLVHNGGSGGGVEATTFGAVSTATWYFVVAQHDSVNNLLKISVNDGTMDTSAYSAGVGDGAADFNIGRRSYPGFADHFDGILDEIGIWKRMLSSAEITELYNAGSGRDYAYISGGGGGGATGVGFLLLLGCGA
jgi:hypothetical protein